MTVELRELSPISGTSILMTSAPRSAISMYGTVPAWAVEHATTRTPCSGPCGSVMSDTLLSRPRHRRCADGFVSHQSVVPAKAGTHFGTNSDADGWVPAFAGTTI